MAQQKMTIETLAEMINNGFTQTQKHIDKEVGAINTQLTRVNERLDTLDARVGRIEADVHALRDEMVHRQEFQDVLDRVKYIEKKLGIESGV